jgi:hypothetical protein
MVSDAGENPVRQLAAALRAVADVASEWAERTAAVTAEALHKLSNDPALRAVWESWRIASWGPRPECECPCARSHPADLGICDHHAVITRILSPGRDGVTEVALCAPCAVAQGVAEMSG